MKQERQIVLDAMGTWKHGVCMPFIQGRDIFLDSQSLYLSVNLFFFWLVSIRR